MTPTTAGSASVTGSVIPRLLAWTLLGTLPLGSLVSLGVGSLLSKLNNAAAVGGVVLIFIAAEALVVYLVLRQTPRLTVAGGKLTIGHLLDRGGEKIPVASVTSIELARGSMAMLALTEGYKGEGRVLLHLTDGSAITLGWDAFAGQADRLALLLGVTLIDRAAEVSRRRAAAAQNLDPGRHRRQTIFVYLGVAAVVVAVLALLFGPLVISIFQLVTRR